MARSFLLGTVLLLTGCGDSDPSAPGNGAPRLTSVLPASATPFDSPLELILEGRDLDGVRIEGPPWLFLEPLERSGGRVRVRAGFRGGPPGDAWIHVSTLAGRDSLPFQVLPLSYGDSLTETRALWVSRFEYDSEGGVGEIMRKAEEAGFNLVYFQVRGRADAFYESSLEPWAASLTGTLGQDPGWDPLGVAVREGSNRGLEVHAWINAFTGWAGSSPPPISDPPHAFLEHPDWVMVDQGGTPMPYGTGTRWMSPGHPEVRTRLARVAADIARNYDVGGIHLDFIRYPSTDYSYDLASMWVFDSVRALEPGLDFDEMRRRFVTWAVAEVRDSLAGFHPVPELSGAVWGIYRNVLNWSSVTTGVESVLQDARAWDRQGIVDALVPMVYWPLQPVYGERLDFAFLADEHSLAIGGPVFIGMNVHGLDGRSVAQQVERARMAGAQGVSVFSYSGLVEGGLWGALQSWSFFQPARRAN